MKKKLLIGSIVLFMSAILFLFYIQKEDDGKRKAIDVHKVDWEVFQYDGLEDSDKDEEYYKYEPWEWHSIYGVNQIEIDNHLAHDTMYDPQLIELFRANPELISNENKKGFVSVYVRFEKEPYFNMISPTTKYDGKDTRFYIKESVVAEVLKEFDHFPSYDEEYPDQPKSDN